MNRSHPLTFSYEKNVDIDLRILRGPEFYAAILALRYMIIETKQYFNNRRMKKISSGIEYIQLKIEDGRKLQPCLRLDQ